jgi:hypothetical protein
MNSTTLRRVTGAAGLTAALLVLIEVPLYFVYDGPPPDSNVLTRSLIGLVGMGFVLVFMANLRQLVKVTAPAYEWVGNLAATAGLMWVAVEFVSNGLETGAVIQSDKPIDPTIAVSGTYILYGTTSRLLQGLFMVALAYTVLRTRVLPRWVGVTAILMAVLNVAFLPSLYFGNDPANFYAANGWGTTASMGAVFSLWLLAVAIATFRAPKALRATA